MSLLTDLQQMYDPAAKQLNVNLSRLGVLGTSLSKSLRSSTLNFSAVASAPEEKAGVIAFNARSVAVGDARPHILFPSPKVTGVTCSIYQADTNPVLVISCKLSSDWRVPDSLPWLQSTFWDDLVLKRGTAPAALLISTGTVLEPTFQVQLSEGIHFYGPLDELQGVLNSASWILGIAPKGFGSITLYDDRPPSVSFTLQIANPQEGLAGLFGSLKMPVEASLNSNLGPGHTSDGLLLTTTIPWAGHDTRLDALLPSQGVSVVELSVEGQLPLPSADDVARYLGGHSVTEHLPDQFGKALSSIHVSKFTLGVGLGSKKVEYARVVLSALEDSKLVIVPHWVEVSNLRFQVPIFFGASGASASYRLSGTLDIGGVDLLVSAQLVPTARIPDLTVVVQLDELDQIDLTQIAQKFGLPSGVPQILVTEFQMGASTAGTFFVRSGLSEHPLGSSQSAFVMTNLMFELDYDGTQPLLNLEGEMTVAGVPVSLSLSNSNGWVFQGIAGGDEANIPLGRFIQDIARDLDAPVPQQLVQAVQDIEIKNLQVVFDTQNKSFQFTADTVTKGQLPLGTKSYELDTKVQLFTDENPSTRQRSFTGHLEADLQIGKATFVVSFDFGPGAKIFKGMWRSADGTTVGFEDMAEALGISHTITVPQGLDLGLKSAAFEYHSDSNTFILSAESRLFGDAFFTAGKGSSGSWGFIFGVDFPPQSKLSSLPVIGSDLKAADFLSFKQSAVLLASTTFKNVTLPSLPALPPQASTSAAQLMNIPSGRSIKPVASAASLQLTPGLSLVAILDFSASSGNQKTKNLHSIVGGDELALQITVGQSGLSLFASLAGNVAIPSGRSKLRLTSPMVRIDLTTEIVFQLSGGTSFVINGAQIVATVRLIISETEAQVAVDISSDHGSLPAPPGVKGLHFQDFGMIMGVFFEPPGLDLGLQGKFRIGEVQGTRDDEFAIVLEVIEELPNLLYLSFYVDKLDLGQVVTLFTDKSEPAIVQAMEIVKASDLSFHWSEGVVALPDGSIAQPGFGFSASIQILDFGAHADLEVSTSNGIHGHAEMAPVNLKGILSINGDGKGITRTYQQLNSQWQLVTNDSIVRQKSVPPTRKEVIVAPGGPIIDFNCLKSPFVHLNWQVTLFDVEKMLVDVTISTSGFSFLLTYNVAGIERFDLSCTLKDRDHFNASARLHIGVDTRVGPIRVAGIDCGALHLVVRVDAGMNVVLDPSIFHLGVDGGFNFEGLSFTVPTLNLSVAPSSLKELPGKIVQQIQDHANQIFAALFADARKWAEMIGRGVVVGVTDMANALKNAYHKTAQEAAQLMKTANQAANTVASGLKTAYGLTADAAASAMKGAGYAAQEVADGLRQGYNLTAQATTAALKGAGYAVDQIGNALKVAYGQTAQQAAQLLHQAGYAADQVGTALRSAFGTSAQQAAQLLRGAGFAADQVGNALKSAFGQTAQQAAQALRQAGYAADEVGNVLKSSFGQTPRQAAQVLKGAGFAVDQVGNALKNVWGASADTVAGALKGAGYAVDQVGNFVKNAFNLGPDALKNVLQGVGYAGDQIKGFFNGLGGAFADTFKDIGNKLDPRHW